MEPSSLPNTSHHRNVEVPSSLSFAPITVAATSAFADPYAQQTSYSSHYVQAYMQSRTVTSDHAVSSSYTPSMNFQKYGNPNLQPSTFRPSAAWYQPGNSRCSYKGCSFTASHKALEIHMMDRHLIYPPGWDRRQKKSDWDTDPSLKGKPIPIQGTNLILDKPEDLDAWLAERKKRWPTAVRVEDKKRKWEEAVARGQLPIEGQDSRTRKRQRADAAGPEPYSGRARGRGRGRFTDSGWRGRGRGRGTLVATCSEVSSVPEVLPPNSSQTNITQPIGLDEDAPEVSSSKAPECNAKADERIIVSSKYEDKYHQDTAKSSTKCNTALPHQLRKTSHQPKREAYNPFASRPTLLRNLLLPEIRVTISNLSQTIRFLVDNNFLENVEMKPGETDDKMVQVINDVVVEEVPCV